MTAWRDLMADLQRLIDESPRVLVSCPTPDPDRPAEEQAEIHLAAYAEDVAADLKARYGKLVSLRVGHLAYPGRRGGRRARPPRYNSASDRLDAGEWGLSAALAEPGSPPQAASGFSVTVPLEITNRSEVDRHLHTNGVLQTYVVDPDGDIVGSYAGFQVMPLKVFTARAGESVQVPALVGTASLERELGFAVPPGPWAFVVELTLGGELWDHSAHKKTVTWSSPLPLLVTARS